jgi:hypothetical protein
LGDGEGVLPDGEMVFGGARNRRLLHLHAIDSAAITRIEFWGKFMNQG